MWGFRGLPLKAKGGGSQSSPLLLVHLLTLVTIRGRKSNPMSYSVGQMGNKSTCKAKKSRLQCGGALSTAANHMTAGGPQTAILPAPKDENDRKETVGSPEQQLLRSVDVHWQGDWTRPAAHHITAAAAATVVYCVLQRPPPPLGGHILPSSPMSFIRTTSDVLADGSKQSTTGHVTPKECNGGKKTIANACTLCKEVKHVEISSI